MIDQLNKKVSFLKNVVYYVKKRGGLTPFVDEDGDTITRDDYKVLKGIAHDDGGSEYVFRKLGDEYYKKLGGKNAKWDPTGAKHHEKLVNSKPHLDPRWAQQLERDYLRRISGYEFNEPEGEPVKMSSRSRAIMHELVGSGNGGKVIVGMDTNTSQMIHADGR